MKPVEIIEFFKFFDLHAQGYNDRDEIYENHSVLFPVSVSRFRFSTIWRLWELTHSLGFSYTILEMDVICLEAPQIKIYCNSDATWHISVEEVDLQALEDIQELIENFNSLL